MGSGCTKWLARSGCLLAVGLTAALGPLGCGDGHSHDDDDGHVDEGHDHDAAVEVGTPTGSTCPSDNELTYDSFGRGFVESYCTRCHSSELEGDARNGATPDHDFDTLLGILQVAEHMDQMAAAGPDATNTTMPPNGDKPSLDEREQLGQWLACELEALEE
jgi:hypothetical protein